MLHLFDISHIISTYGYLGIFLVVFLESGIFFALPGDTLLFTAGVLAPIFGLNLFLLILVIFVATFFGGMVGYQIGIYFIRLERFSFFRKIFKREYINKAHEFFDKYGKLAVVSSRFIVIVRTFTPIVAGIVRMRYFSFIKYSVIGSILWSMSLTMSGYFLGKSFPQIKDYLSWFIVLVVFISILPGIIPVLRKVFKQGS